MKRKPKPPFDWHEYRRMADSANSTLAERTFVLPTEFSHYLVRFRTLATARPTIMKLLENEGAANELWKLCDTGEIEDLLTHLREHPPSAELIAMVMLTGRSKLEHLKQTSKGGQAKASPYASLMARAVEAWRNDKSRRSKNAFAGQWLEMVAKQERMPEEELPEASTVRKWLAGIEKETRK